MTWKFCKEQIHVAKKLRSHDLLRELLTKHQGEFKKDKRRTRKTTRNERKCWNPKQLKKAGKES